MIFRNIYQKIVRTSNIMFLFDNIELLFTDLSPKLVTYCSSRLSEKLEKSIHGLEKTVFIKQTK